MPLITLEGIDKSGKATQTQVLAQKLLNMEKKVETIAFPDYTTPLGRMIEAYLHGEIDICAEIRQLLYVANRWERCENLRTWLKNGTIVIADRYVPSGLVYGLANKLELNWLINLERGLPASDLVIVLDISIQTAFRRETDRDVYEANEEFLEAVRRAYLDLAKRFGWIVLVGDKTKREVAEDIWKHVSKIV